VKLHPTAKEKTRRERKREKKKRIKEEEERNGEAKKQLKRTRRGNGKKFFRSFSANRFASASKVSLCLFTVPAAGGFPLT
jgi:hypothetical protein